MNLNSSNNNGNSNKNTLSTNKSPTKQQLQDNNNRQLNDSTNKSNRYDFAKNRAQEIFNDDQEDYEQQQQEEDDDDEMNDVNNGQEQYDRDDFDDEEDYQQHHDSKSKESTMNRQNIYNNELYNTDQKLANISSNATQKNNNIVQQSDNNNIYGNAGLQPISNLTSLHNTSKNNYFNINNDGIKQGMLSNTTGGGKAPLQQDRFTPTKQQKVTVLDPQFKPYYMNSTYNRSSSKNRKKADTSATQIYEGNNGQLLVSNKVIRFTENGVKQGTNNTQRQQLANLSKQRKTNELIQNYITSVPIQPNQYIPPENKTTLNANSNALKPPMLLPDMRLQRELSAPKGIGTAPSGKRVRQYNKVIMDFQDKYYRKKTRPNQIMVSAEELYDENMQLKYKINQQDQFILMQKTQNKLLNNELEKQQELLKQLIQASSKRNESINTINGQDNNNYHQFQSNNIKNGNNQNQHEILLMNLKRELDSALKTLSLKETEIKNLQRQSKVTKFREVDEERKVYMQESFRLHKIIKDMITRGMGRNGKALSSHRSSVKPQQPDEQQFQVHQFDQQLQQQLSDQNQSITQLQLDNQQLREQKDDHQHQNNLMTSQIQQIQQQKHEAELLAINLQNENQQLQQQLELSNQQQNDIFQSQKQLSQSEKDQLKKLQALNEQLTNDNDKLRKDINDYQSKITDLNKLMEQKDMLNQQEVLMLNNQLNSQTHLISDLRDQVNNLEGQLRQVTQQLKEVLAQKQQQEQVNNENDATIQDYFEDEFQNTNNQINLPKSLSSGKLQEASQKNLNQTTTNIQEQQEDQQIDDNYEENNESYDGSANILSGIQDNYGTMEITKKQLEFSKLEQTIQDKTQQLQQQDNELHDLKQQLEYKDKVAHHMEQQVEQLKLDLQQLTDQLQQQDQDFQEEFNSKMRELTEQIEIKDNEISEQKQLIEGDIKQRLKRCLTILQIRDEKDLDKFFMSNIPIQQDFSPLDMIIMRFNFTQYESLVTIEDLLKLNPKQCELSELIQKLIDLFIPLDIPSDDVMLENFKDLQQKLTDQNLSLDTFLAHHGYDELQMIHYLSITKTLQLYLSDNYQISTMVLHLLNQSKNFTQIDVNVLRRCMNLQITARFTTTQRSIKKNNSASDLQKVTPPTNKKHSIGEQRLSMNVSGIEKDQILDKKEDTDNQLRLALDNIKGKLKRIESGDGVDYSGNDNNDEEDDGTSELMQLNMNANLAFSERSGISAATKSVNNFAIQQKQMKFLKNVQLQLIASALNAKFMNLRNKLQIYHTNQIEHILGVEVEVIKLSDFYALLKRLKVLQYEDGTEEDLQSQEMIEDMLIQLESVYTIESLDQKVIILNKLVQGLQAFGYQDHQLPKSKKGLHFDELDVKSIRIMNRIVQHVQKEVVEFLKRFNINVQALNKQQMHQIYTQIMESIVFKGYLTKVLLNARNKEEKCFLITQEAFYKRLKELGIKRKASEYENLNRFLWIDIQFPQYILFKKLIKAIEIIQSNPYCRAIGFKKVSLDDQTIIVKTSKNNSKYNQSDNKSRQSRMILNGSELINDIQNNTNNTQNNNNINDISNDDPNLEESYYEEEESKRQDDGDDNGNQINNIQEEQSYYEESQDQF